VHDRIEEVKGDNTKISKGGKKKKERKKERTKLRKESQSFLLF